MGVAYPVSLQDPFNQSIHKSNIYMGYRDNDTQDSPNLLGSLGSQLKPVKSNEKQIKHKKKEKWKKTNNKQ